ncbi:MAG TPA: class I SAM-dependent methyltransferase [Candidatus Paceibacterota bacterium]|nr:class I SAM-dependent methyltransferase [Candidatus Paceibacterota bacterium]
MVETEAIANRDLNWKINESAALSNKFDHLKGFLPEDFASVLDVAAGTGALHDSLAKWKEHRYTMVDISPEAVRQAQQKGIEAVIADVENQHLPFPDNSFDLVVATHLLEHLRNPWSALADMARVSNRYIFVYCPNFVTLSDRFRVLFGRAPTQMRADAHGGVVDQQGRHIDHIYFMTYANFVYWAERLGLEVLRSRAWWYRRYAPLRWILEPLFKNFADSFEIILVKPAGWRMPDNPNFQKPERK